MYFSHAILIVDHLFFISFTNPLLVRTITRRHVMVAKKNKPKTKQTKKNPPKTAIYFNIIVLFSVSGDGNYFM